MHASNTGKSPDLFTLSIGPFLHLHECQIRSVPIRDCIGVTCHPDKDTNDASICVWPVPVAIPRGDRFEILPSPDLWQNELKEMAGSHLICLALPPSESEEDLLHAMKLLHGILANRTLHSRHDIYQSFYTDKMLSEAVKKAYGSNPDTKTLANLLGANALSEKQARRIRESVCGSKEKAAKEPISMSARISIIDGYGVDLEALKVWNAFAAEAGCMSYEEIVLKVDEGRREEAVKWLNTCLGKSQDALHEIWRKTKNRLQALSQEEVSHEEG